ncbi:dipeptidyl aminopeptidase/acylaminoacyl peptidase [Chitinophaga polysaccharea]|uniref:Dipeptidyl aminopeptidase/acylaminoacyl peptidase n=1 Tax=Chitinophaga polysaccharea TaxID=1293035 RepID=A0A561PLR2_9BACT|nr:prolyl oligopeptidase family serine peptidase [Chitinophaga polysaccharea]TWF39036.1 dipeptidyl aminopeptidase/acylaminoacyl peptidase [Chitinophaga polysaccharea]
MRYWVIPAIIFFSANSTFAQQAGPLTVEKMMRDPKWIGTSPDHVFWGTDNQTVYFDWNPDKQLSDSLYYASTKNNTPRKTDAAERALIKARASGAYNTDKTLLAYSYQGDIYLLEIKTGKVTRITNTAATENSPVFSFGGKQVVFQQNNDLFAWDRAGGLISQLTSFDNGSKPVDRDERKVGNVEEQTLKAQQLELMQVVRDRTAKKDAATAFNRAHEPATLRRLYLQNKSLYNIGISPDGRFITYTLYTAPTGIRNTIVPEFVTASGYTTDISTRDKVGSPQGSYESYVYDRQRDTMLPVKTTDLPGIKDQPDYVKDYTKKDTPAVRDVQVNGPWWSDQGTHAIAEVRSQDNKDRWIVLLDAATGTLKTLNRQRDEAWIGGPGIDWGNGNIGWIDENTAWFQSEATGYSHLYTVNVNNGDVKQLTSGQYEIQDAQLSPDKKYFYLTTNEVHPGEKQFYRMPVQGGRAERITTLPGANEVQVSPDGKWLAFRYSYSNKPWELYLQPNSPGSPSVQVTRLGQSDEFKSYPWRDPQVITFMARDQQPVYARLYTPDPAKNNGAAVIFVHGAGYLQNAHKWWSSYFREYMFHNLLTDKGYTVLDMDYRGSAGYGRNWRTGIYRHMGGKDLDDEVDGAKYLAEKLQVDARRIGIYGGSYGGFMTLMAMFTQPGTFAAGAALRSVTDWAHYNHGYTSNILNEPFTDSIAYRRSSPIYFAEGLRGKLLMCHGMIDTNVHFQDIVRLSQRLIELGKNNWELAVYPVEDHGFITPSSWTDEYKRILLLFESTLLKP